MLRVSACEARARFGEMLARVSEGEEIAITRYGRVAARLVPEGAPHAHEVRRAVAGLLDLQARIGRRSRANVSDREVRAAIDMGRSGSRS